MWGQVKKYAPFAMLLGYALVYMNKGWDRILTDIQAITPQKLMAKWQNLAVAAVALVAVQFITKAKIPPMMKVLIIALLYLIAGHQIATAIDPPGYNNGSMNGGSVAATRNRYAGA